LNEMDTQEIAEIIGLLKALVSKQTAPYDYLVLILPVATGIMGWFLSTLWQARQFRQNNAKEHYYLVRGKAESIIADYSSLLDSTYNFFKNCKNSINLGTPIDGDAINDFITQFQFKLAAIHQTQKLMFPNRRFSTKKVLEHSDKLVENVREMNTIRQQLLLITQQAKKNDKEIRNIFTNITRINDQNLQTIQELTKEVSIVENEMVELINTQAKKLGIA